MNTEASGPGRSRYLTIGAVMGAAVAFILGRMFEDVLQLIAGALAGTAVAVVVWALNTRQQRRRRAVELAQQPKADLVTAARRLRIDGAASMTKAELAEAITYEAERDPTGDLLVEAADALGEKVQGSLDGARRRLARRNGARNGARSGALREVEREKG